MARVTKKIYYFRTVNSTGAVTSYHNFLNSSLATHGKIGDSEVNFVDYVIRVQRFAVEENRTVLHLTKYCPGNKNSVLTPKASGKIDTEVGHSAPVGKEFKSGECFLLISGYHILFCSNGMSHQKAELYIHKLFQQEGVKFEPFKFVPASKLDRLALLRAQGVKSIKLNVGAFKLSLPNEKKGWFRNAIQPVANELSALVSKDQSRSEEKAMEDLVVSLEIGLDGNSRAVEDAKLTVLDLAEEILDDEELGADGFIIMTQDNVSVSSNDIRLSTGFRVTQVDTSINHSETWQGMIKYYNELRNDGLLEQ